MSWKAKAVLATLLLPLGSVPQALPEDPPSRVARLSFLTGSVSFRPGTVDEWTSAE